MLRRGLLALALAAPLAGCGSSMSTTAQSSAQPAQASARPVPSRAGGSNHSVEVAIVNYAYKPVHTTVARGTRITFTNHDATAHTATSAHPGFDTGTVKPGQSRTITVTKPGTYNFYCQFHAFMRGQVTVR